MEAILYSTNCPKCMILKEKLNEKKIKYKEINDVEIMQNKGIMTVPMLEVENNLYTFLQANDYINNYCNKEA